MRYKKSFSIYVFFASTLLGTKPELSYLNCCWEEEASGHVFPGAVHLLRSLHIKRNVKAKLRELGVAESVQQVIIGDIFGK